MKTHTIIPAAIEQHFNQEAATQGAASQCQNLREREQSLQVVGTPVRVATIGAGERLLTVDADRYIVLHEGSSVRWGDAVLATLDEGSLTGVHVVGDFLVIVTTTGCIYLHRTATGYDAINPADAVPAITLAEASTGSMTTTMPAYTFSQPLTQWQYPLASDDVQALTSLVASTWSALKQQVADAGKRACPILARYAVRLWDDSYLYVSDPVQVGMGCVKANYRVSCDATPSGGKYVGLPQTTMTMNCFTLGITPTAGIGAAWQGLVKSVDILVTGEAAIANPAVLDYRMGMTTVGTRRYMMELGPTPRSAAAIESDLSASPWHLAARTIHIAELASGTWVDDPIDGITLTNAQIAAMITGSATTGATRSMAHNGRLYLGNAGTIMVSMIDNPMVVSQRVKVVGSEILALAIASRPIYSGGYGRFPVYVFTTEGIFALPQLTSGTYGEARMMSRKVIARGTLPAEGDGSIWFVTGMKSLCDITGAKVTVRLRNVEASQMAWNDHERELVMRDNDGGVCVLGASGRYYSTTLQYAQLYADGIHALAVTAGGEVCDLQQEDAATQAIDYRSAPIAVDFSMRAVPSGVTWNVMGDNLDLKLSILGERGSSCHGFLVNRIHLKGNVHAPFRVPLVPQPLRTLRLAIAGKAPSGTLITPMVLSWP